MSDSKKTNEMNDKELKQVAGGRMDNMKRHYRCPVCGYEEWVTITLGSPTPLCRICLQNGQEVKMMQIG